MDALPHSMDNISLEAYWQLEEKSIERHEFHNGSLVAMAGATVHHSLIATNIRRAIGNRFADSGCFVLDNDVKVAIGEQKHFLYPDATILCEDIEYFENRRDTILNPKLIIEVLSDSTEAYDRGKKFSLYRDIQSFEEYVLVSQKEALVDVYSKKGDNIWQIRTYEGLENLIVLESLHIQVPISDIYQHINF